LNAPKGACWDYQARFYQPFGSYLEPVTRNKPSVGPGCYDVGKAFSKLKPSAAKMMRSTIGDGDEEAFTIVDHSRVFLNRHVVQQERTNQPPEVKTKSINFSPRETNLDPNASSLTASIDGMLVSARQPSQTSDYHRFLKGLLTKDEFHTISYNKQMTTQDTSRNTKKEESTSITLSKTS
jgi:hypothetical protein